ncbi:MAG: hypothetical protein M1820_000285 [Bogoriella megaspora]|nr:MAG: hypothetical protein M1820_000285 [Bogoriella megaspora]
MEKLFTTKGATPSKELPIRTAEDGIPATDFLIVGAGPAGASLACFLASHGLHGIIIANTSGCADTPRAHITNPAGLECLRDIGLDEECIHQSTKGDCMRHTRWSYSMTGHEYARIHAWGNDPKRHGDYDAASPFSHVDLPQTQLEPILVRYATLNGWVCRWNTRFLKVKTLPDETLESRLHDDIVGSEYTIRSKYLFGCDGGRSQVAREIELPMIKQPGQGLAINVLARVDLTDHIKTRPGNLHWVLQPDIDLPDFGWAGIVRMIKPWTEWMFIFLPAPGSDFKLDPAPTADDYHKRLQQIVGDPSIPIEILDVSSWSINETVAEYYSSGHIICLGDSCHRHPPFNGLGSNTCVQDAFNLAWKVAYVEKGLASPSLLSTYSTERQPVGHSVVTRANNGLRTHIPVWSALGMLASTPSERTSLFNELSAATPAGAQRRQALRAAVENTASEFHGIGIEMNQRYSDSTAIDTTDEKDSRPLLPDDPVLHYQISTYPGARLPHAWLNTRSPGKQFSTIDLAGHGAFCLLTGVGGQGWKEAARVVGERIGVGIRAYAIGWCQDFEDVYFDWERRREVGEDGCVLVRPDRFVAWRAAGMVGDCVGKLERVMENIGIGRVG